MPKTTLLLALIFVSGLARAADCQRDARQEARQALGPRAEVAASMSEGLGEDHFLIRFHALLAGQRQGTVSCESYNNVCDCRFNR